MDNKSTIRTVSILLQFFFLFFLLSEANSNPLKPQAFESFNVSYIQNPAYTCSYTVIITTSCSSTRYTRDQISIAFGDVYGNQIYAPRLDDPSTRTFEQCSSDTFEIYGPCAYQICYVYFYRSGPDGWKPEGVKIYGYGSRAVTFYYNTFVPSDIWYGFNLCHSSSSVHSQSRHRWSISVIIGFVLSAIIIL
ncbi:hypothetical protein SLA2020_228490 [Shorea laevis]